VTDETKGRLGKSPDCDPDGSKSHLWLSESLWREIMQRGYQTNPVTPRKQQHEKC
jgi:hypothetical protein